MRTWTLRRGYPLVSVEWRDGKALVSQAPFTIGGSGGSGDGGVDGGAAAAPSSCDAAAQLGAWWLPLAYTTGGDGGALRWSELAGCSGELPAVQLGAGDEYLLVNSGRYGFYRANYSAELWERLYRAAPGTGRLSATDYAGGRRRRCRCWCRRWRAPSPLDPRADAPACPLPPCPPPQACWTTAGRCRWRASCR
jgi:aminopeptidase N